jgi:hypothetical protein
MSNIDYEKANKLGRKAKGLLTRAEKSEDIEYREAKIEEVTGLFDEMGAWPDWWHRLQRLEDDTAYMARKARW